MWENWSGELRCAPARTLRPSTAGEVARAVVEAREAGQVVRVAGAGHSFTPVVLTDGTLLSLDRLAGVLDVDRAGGRVRVAGGTTINALSRELDRHGLALENLGDIDVQAIAGALATSTHGTGGAKPSLPQQVEAVELVTADGSVVRAARDDADDGLFRAACVAVGALGVVTAVELRVVPAFTLRRVDRPEPLEDVLDSLDERIAAHPHFELFCFPYARDALTRTSDVVDGPPRPPGPWGQRRETWTTNTGLELLVRLGARFPSSIPLLNRLVTRLAGTSTKVDRSFRCFASPRHVRFTETEWSLPRAAAADVVRAVRAWCDERRYPVNFPFEVRFVAPDDADLGTAHGRASAYVAVHAYRGMPFEELFAAVQAIALAHGGRPHWGKRHALTARELAPLYPRWDAFQAQRAALDPEGVFTNAHVAQVLGAPGVVETRQAGAATM
ncbi:D-arabinono-1,4-lactone oxidase [Conexibacter sp. SYSU D00693]|uniref:D-arabinono-1,4-lactone oxidase n=1 Tax=Conexibacter sp. SYSU D00693 TaxID=2812560 RepID=UPI00196B556A|nr:D-arabinono-1,4-lactone oxidase [Conexibacter sp. SYSU D00693]